MLGVLGRLDITPDTLSKSGGATLRSLAAAAVALQLKDARTSSYKIALSDAAVREGELEDALAAEVRRAMARRTAA